jgi:hypothetical protein
VRYEQISRRVRATLAQAIESFAVAFRLPITLSTQDFVYFGIDLTAHTFAHLRFANLVTKIVARFATDWVGSPLPDGFCTR